MIAVKALYRGGNIEFLESPPDLVEASVIIVFLEGGRVEDILASYATQVDDVDWGQPLDEEGAKFLVALHDEFASYRTEVNQTYDPTVED